VTSAGELENGHPTGLWLEEAATPYYMFKNEGYKVIIASPKGGAAPIDANSFGEGMFTDYCKKFMHDGEAVGALCHTVKLDDVDLDSTDALYMVGGHGTCVDFVNNPTLKNLVEQIYRAGKIVAADCHGVNILAECTELDGETPLLKDKLCTGFSSSEEMEVQLDTAIPFLIQEKFIELGANYEAGPNWTSKVCVDGNLITGQNPQSSEACAAAVISALS